MDSPIANARMRPLLEKDDRGRARSRDETRVSEPAKPDPTIATSKAVAHASPAPARRSASQARGQGKREISLNDVHFAGARIASRGSRRAPGARPASNRSARTRPPRARAPALHLLRNLPAPFPDPEALGLELALPLQLSSVPLPRRVGMSETISAPARNETRRCSCASRSAAHSSLRRNEDPDEDEGPGGGGRLLRRGSGCFLEDSATVIPLFQPSPASSSLSRLEPQRDLEGAGPPRRSGGSRGTSVADCRAGWHSTTTRHRRPSAPRSPRGRPAGPPPVSKKLPEL